MTTFWVVVATLYLYFAISVPLVGTYLLHRKPILRKLGWKPKEGSKPKVNAVLGMGWAVFIVLVDLIGLYAVHFLVLHVADPHVRLLEFILYGDLVLQGIVSMWTSGILAKYNPMQYIGPVVMTIVGFWALTIFVLF